MTTWPHMNAHGRLVAILGLCTLMPLRIRTIIPTYMAATIAYAVVHMDPAGPEQLGFHQTTLHHMEVTPASEATKMKEA